MKRREFLRTATAGVSAAALLRRSWAYGRTRPLFEISLAGWSLHRRYQNGALPMLEFPRVAREEFDIGAIEPVNTMFPSPHYSFCQQLRQRAEEHDVKILLIMCDGEGDLSSADAGHRRQAVRNHHKWLDIGAVLGCYSIRVNTSGTAGNKDDIKRCAESLHSLAEYGAPLRMSVLVENHGGISSDPKSLVEAIRLAAHEGVGTLPDFGNFPREVDRYEAIAAMMPYAKAVSAKCYDFGDDGSETRLDFPRLLSIVTGSGYRGYVGIEYEGSRLSEHDGILAARKLLESIRTSAG